MSVEIYNTDWFWWAMLLGFFVQFAAPLKEPPQPAKPIAKRAKPKRNATPKQPKQKIVKQAKPKRKKPQPWSLEQEIMFANYRAKRDGFTWANNMPA